MKKTKITKKIVAALVLGALATGLMACGNKEESTTASSEKGTTAETTTTSDAEKETEAPVELKTIRLVTPGVDAEGNASKSESLFIADQKGYVEEELNKIGYTVEYTGFATAGVGENEALAAGEADIAVYGDFPALTYLANNNDAKLIAVASTRQQLGILAADGISSVKDLKGKKIGTILGTVAYKYLLDELEANGLTTDDVEIVNATSDIASLFISGDIDAVSQSTQYLYYIQNAAQKGNIVAVAGDDVKLSSNFVFVAKNSLIEESPEIVSALKTALARAKEDAAADPDAVYQAFTDATAGAITLEQYTNDTAFDKTFSYWEPELTDDVIVDLQETADFMFDNQYIGAKLDVKSVIAQ